MPRYFFHLRDGIDQILDPDGVELSPERIASFTLHQARDCMAGDVRSGELDLRYHIDVHDADGTVIHTLSFADALTIVPPEKTNA